MFLNEQTTIKLDYHTSIFLNLLSSRISDAHMELLPRDIVAIIVTLSINSDESYRNVFIVCKEWYSVIDHITAENKYTNHLTMLLKLFPDENGITVDYLIIQTLHWNMLSKIQIYRGTAPDYLGIQTSHGNMLSRIQLCRGTTPDYLRIQTLHGNTFKQTQLCRGITLNYLRIRTSRGITFRQTQLCRGTTTDYP